MKYIERPMYLQRLVELRGTPDIKIITGIRRCGKTRLMTAWAQKVKEMDPGANIISIDLTSRSFEPLKEYHAFHRYVEERYRPGCDNYLFVDEVQLCPQFELAVNSLYGTHHYDIYLTGSNAFLLSADLAALFTGRCIELPMFPFSFKEYCTYYAENTDIHALFDAYVLQGGFAGSYVYRSEKDRMQYIREVYETITTRDPVQKYRLPDTAVLEHLGEYLTDNISTLTSPNRISGTLTANRVPTNHATIGRYIKYLCSAFLFYDVKRYDIKGKRYLETADKYYLCDTGFRTALLGRRNLDYGRLYENIVCIELLRRGYDVYIGKLYEKEVDFVALRGSEKLYIQVSDDISAPDAFAREYTPLLKIADAYPKLILANTRHETYDYEGIQVYDMAGWLLTI